MSVASISATMVAPDASAVKRAQEVKQAYTSFVGETFFSQMLGAMRSTVGEPAYFSGGQAEKTMRSQLDAQLAQDLAASTGDRFAEPIFAQQFPREAEILKQAEAAKHASLGDLDALRRR